MRLKSVTRDAEEVVFLPRMVAFRGIGVGTWVRVPRKERAEATAETVYIATTAGRVVRIAVRILAFSRDMERRGILDGKIRWYLRQPAVPIIRCCLWPGSYRASSVFVTCGCAIRVMTD
jgi:hypothetical protein